MRSVLGAAAYIAGPDGEREVAVEQFCTGPGRNVLEPGEFVVSIQFPAPAAQSGAGWERFIPRNEMDIAVAGAAVALTLEDDKRTVKTASTAICAVAPTPLMVPEAGAALTGAQMDDAALDAAARASEAAANPISDMRGTVEFRIHLAGVLTRRTAVIAKNRAAAN